MQQENVLNKIGVVLRELNEQYEFLNRSRERINDIELELFAANAKYLIEFIEFSRKIHANQPPKIEQYEPIAPTVEEIAPIKEEEKIIYTLDIEEEIEEMDTPEPEVKEEIVREPLIEETVFITEEEVEEVKIIEPEKEIIPEPVLDVKPETLATPFTTLKSGVDLRNLIGLNQKYLFTRALFKNDATAYEDVLTVLNTFQNETRAMIFLKERVISKFGWDMESEEVEAFLLLLKKKFNG